MKKGWTAALAAGMLAFVLVATPGFVAAESKTLRAVANLSIDMSTCGPPPPNDCHWSGTVSGDLKGSIEIFEYWDQMFLPGNTEHFFEYFTITMDSGGWISGVDQGVWNMGTQKFRANGWFTDASSEWTDLVGHKLHEIGSTSGSGIVTGIADLTIVGP